VLLSVALVAVVGLAKVLSHPLEAAVERFHLPRSVVGIAVAMIVLLATTLLVCVITVGTGRTSVMQGAVHLVLFATYLFLACVP
jgi:Ca2+:H+ antiporter